MALINNMILIPEGWRSVTKDKYSKAVKTRDFACTLLAVLDGKDLLTSFSFGRSLTATQVKDINQAVNSRPTDFDKPTEGKVRKEDPGGKRLDKLKDILTKALLDSALVINAYELVLQKKPNIKIISRNTMLSVLANTPPTLLEQLEASIRIPENSYVLIDSDLALSTVQSLVKALGQETPKRNHRKRETSKSSKMKK
jgi:hypothetical protein